MRPGTPRPRPHAVALALFVACVVLGSGNFIAVRFSNLDLPPLWGAGLRFSLAATVFVVIALAARVPWPPRAMVRGAALLGLLNFGVFYALMYWALLHLTAGVATVVMATVPLATLGLAVAQGLERLRARAVWGALAAVLGIAWMSLAPGALTLPALPLLALVAAVACVAQSIILAKRVSSLHPAMVNALAMPVGAAVLLLASRAAGEPWAWPTLPEARWALLYLVVLGSVGLFGLTLLLIRRWAPSATSYVFVAMPVTTLLLEALIAGVPVTTAALIGAGLVMLGVWFGALAPGPPAPSADQREAPEPNVRA